MSFQMQPDKMYVMPVQFGPCLGPRQNLDGERYLHEYPRSVVNHTLVYTSEAAAIEPLLPQGLTLDSPHIIVNHRMNRNLSWLAGRGYNLISVRVPVTFHGTQGVVKGFFMLAIWENEPDPILFGREQLGYCKTYAKIDDLSTDGQAPVHATAVSWEFSFLDLTFDLNTPPADRQVLEALLYDPQRQGDINYKYIPKTGDGFVQADVAYMTLTPKVTTYPADVPTFPAPQVDWCSGSLIWHRPRWEDMPTQFRTVDALSALPVKAFLGATRTTAQSLNDTFNQLILH